MRSCAKGEKVILSDLQSMMLPMLKEPDILIILTGKARFELLSGTRLQQLRL